MPGQKFIIPSFTAETGRTFQELELFYYTYGTYRKGISRVVWVCHALTASADCADWWPGLIGSGKAINPEEYFIICVNIPGSCYGSTGPLSINPQTEKPYYSDFGYFTIRDIVSTLTILRKALQIDEIYLLLGGSMGGYQCLEWAIIEPHVVQHLGVVATSPKESAWGIAIHTAQRLAIEADVTFGERTLNAGNKGLKAARAIGMLTYRSYEAYVAAQTDVDDRIDNFKASSYIDYQGDKLVNRFNAYSYHALTKTMDSHNVGRGRGSVELALRQIQAPTVVVGISSDFLCPIAEQQFLAAHIPQSRLVQIDSPFGHDGFLVEGEIIGRVIKDFLKSK
jgi:homoserine O-acetyltransferase